MYFKKRHSAHHKHELGKVFAWLALTVGLGNAAFWTIFPLVVENFIESEAKVGLFFSAISVLTMCGSLLSTVILRHFSRIKVTKYSLLLITISLVIITLISKLFHLPFVEIPRAFFTLLVGIVLSLYVRDTAKSQNLGMTEGRYYLYANVGWLIGPLIGGILGEYLSYDYAFLFSAGMYLISLMIFHHQHIKQHPLIIHKKEKLTIKELWSNIKLFFKKKELRKVYAVSLGMNYWWVISSIYIPIYIIEHGFGESVIGYIVAASMIPLILLEKLIGKLSDKHGIRIYVSLGFLILAIVTGLFNITPIATIVLMLMSVINFGSALIEPLQETYLFKEIKEKDEERFYGVYNTAEPVANIIAPLIGSGLIFFFGISGLWIGSSIMFLMFMIIATRIKK
ncbi:hypothetical protein COY27_00390 [Candidatus Woesearchaeota archaeon CG_4_10_14_0_2_um_filter_33_13]|nr:MAG: hypothetical protein COY27_00390 [Candidatus Woesearchaeota archaeon CG_4_10_14_0_2_um_filter_33_13]